MNFRVGQKIVCVDAAAQENNLLSGLCLNAIYTVHSICHASGIRLCEVQIPAGWCCFKPSRFRPVVERKTNISIFTAMLTPSPERVS